MLFIGKEQTNMSALPVWSQKVPIVCNYREDKETKHEDGNVGMFSSFIRLYQTNLYLRFHSLQPTQFHSPSKSPTWLQPGTDLRLKSRLDNDYANHVQTVQWHQQWGDNYRKQHPVGQLITPTIIGGSCCKYHFCHHKSFVMTNMFVMTNVFCHDKSMLRQT